MMKYVVTGGAGFIGSHLTEKLVEQGNQVTIIDNLNTGKEKNLDHIKKEINFIKGDILDEKLINEITQDVNGVFHQAALASVQDSFTKPDEYRKVNVIGTKNIFEASKKNDGVPVEEKVAAHFLLIIPLFPTPETIIFPFLHLMIASIILLNFLLILTFNFLRDKISVSITSFAIKWKFFFILNFNETKYPL